MIDGEFKRTHTNVWNLTTEAEIFERYIIPNGFLPRDIAAHALFRYYVSARQIYEEIILDPIVYEGDEDPVFNLEELFKTFALAYGTEPERMIKFWPAVDMQCVLLRIPKMPEGDRFRFNHIPNIKIEEVMKEAPKLKKIKELLAITKTKRIH